MKKALMFASVASMIQQFNMENIKLLQSLGYKVDVACNFQFGSTITQEKIEKLKQELRNLSVEYHDIPIPRKISNIKDLNKSFKLTKKLMNKENYNLIHCHSPIGGVICRIANKNSNNYKNSKMIYTAHGFHFFKGNSIMKNFIFRSIERYCARLSDIIITINKEDYIAAQKFKLKNDGKVEYVPGIGINLDFINTAIGDKFRLCKEINVSKDSILLLSVGELSKRKNHIVMINALKGLPNNVHYLICGKGDLEKSYRELSQRLGVSDRVHLLGFRSNIIEIMKSRDIFIFPSLQEGLPVALMEAMACGLPCIASSIRGNVDLLDKKNGILIDKNISSSYIEAINTICENKTLKKELINNAQKNSIHYSTRVINDMMVNIYTDR